MVLFLDPSQTFLKIIYLDYFCEQLHFLEGGVSSAEQSPRLPHWYYNGGEFTSFDFINMLCYYVMWYVIRTSKGAVSIWRAPRLVSSLQHLARLTLRRILSSNDVDNLKSVPPALSRFLAYRRNYWSFTEN